MKNKKQKEKKNKINSNINELNYLTGKRRKREVNDIIINKYDIYSILDDLNYDANYKIPKRNSNEATSNQLKTDSAKKVDKESENFIKSDPYLSSRVEPGNSVSNSINENLIKKEETPSQTDSPNSKPKPSSKQSLLKLILTESQLSQFSEVIQIFTREIKCPFTLDYFMKMKDNLQSEDKDKIINTLLFLVWSLKFMKIDINNRHVNSLNSIITRDSFSLFATNTQINPMSINTDNNLSSHPHSSGHKMFYQNMSSIKSDGITSDMLFNPNIMINKFMSNWSNTLNDLNKDSNPDIKQMGNKEMPSQNFLNISTLQPFGSNYMVPLNILTAVPLINSPTFCLSNSNNIIQNEAMNSKIPEANSQDVISNNKISPEVSPYSFSESRNTYDSDDKKKVEPESHNRNLNNINFSIRNQDKVEESPKTAVYEFNQLNIKREQSFIDITMEDEDEKKKVDNTEIVYSEIVKIFSRPICDETFKLLRNYLKQSHVDKIEETIKKNPFTLKKKQYILLCKKDKEGLYLKFDPMDKKYSISRTFYKSK